MNNQPHALVQALSAAQVHEEVYPQEKCLARAILCRAIVDYLNIDGNISRHVQRSARGYIFGGGDYQEDWPFNFDTLCHETDLDPVLVREALQNQKARILAGVRPPWAGERFRFV